MDYKSKQKQTKNKPMTLWPSERATHSWNKVLLACSEWKIQSITTVPRIPFLYDKQGQHGQSQQGGTTDSLFKALPKRWRTSSISLFSCIAWPQWNNEKVWPWEEILDSVVLCLCSGPHTWVTGIQDTLVNVRGLLRGRGRDKEKRGLQTVSSLKVLCGF